jgi:hypothetical protein
LTQLPGASLIGANSALPGCLGRPPVARCGVRASRTWWTGRRTSMNRYNGPSTRKQGLPHPARNPQQGADAYRRGLGEPGEPPLTLVDPCHIGSPSQSARIFTTSTGKLVSIPIFRSADAARSLVRKRPDADDPGPGADRWLLLALMA